MDTGSDKAMGLDLNLDLISNLPETVIDKILVHLPIRDAVRTSVLSSKWRYKWTSMPKLVFNDESALSIPYRTKNELSKIIHRVLLLHSGLIQKFEIWTSCMLTRSSIDCWLLFLSRKKIKELILNVRDGERYKLHSSLFSFQQICTLELHRCMLKLPRTFTCFGHLKSLYLREVTFSTSRAFESLISKCPLLERLTLDTFDGLEHINICAPNLKNMSLVGNFKDICFEYAPHLSVVSIGLSRRSTVDQHIEQNGLCNLVKVLSFLMDIKKFVVRGFFLEFLAVGNIPEKLPIVYHRLINLSLHLNYEDQNQVLATLCLLHSCPKLRQLEISASSEMGFGMVEFWKTQGHGCNTNMNHLKVVKMTNIAGFSAELLFVLFILTNSPVLEKLSITSSKRLPFSKVEFLTILLRFPRASPLAEIEYLDPDDEDVCRYKTRKRWDDKE